MRVDRRSHFHQATTIPAPPTANAADVPHHPQNAVDRNIFCLAMGQSHPHRQPALSFQEEGHPLNQALQRGNARSLRYAQAKIV